MPDDRKSLREQLSENFDIQESGAESHVERAEVAERPERTENAIQNAGKGVQSTGVKTRDTVAGVQVNSAPVDKGKKAQQPETTEELAKAVTAEGPARGPDGKFVPKKYPGTWKKDLEAHWTKPGGHTPEEWAAIQAEVERRENDYSQGESNWRKRLNEMEPVYKGFTSIFEPIKDRLARTGVDPLALTRQLVAMADYFDRDPAGFITEQARLRGLDLASLVQQQQDSGIADPNVARLENELRQLKAHIQGSQQQAQQTVQSQVKSEVDAFATATNPDGTPKRPHFERVKPLMGRLLAGDGNLTLEQAYEQACYADPEIRQALVQDEWAKREAKRMEDLKRAEDAAKSQRGSGAYREQGPLPKGSSLRAQLAHAWDSQAGDARVA